MSYDEKLVKTEMELEVSIPLEQGSVLRRRLDDDYQAVKSVSIPLEQGSVLRP